jgi:hypothetical protein
MKHTGIAAAHVALSKQYPVIDAKWQTSPISFSEVLLIATGSSVSLGVVAWPRSTWPRTSSMIGRWP